MEIADVIARAIEVASPLLEQRAHALELDVARKGLAVDGDVARLVQVFSNLLTNAGKYTPAAGRITITAGAEGDEIAIRVRDTGMGITADALPRVFDLFVQGAQAIDRAHGGLGLGLTIVRSLVERHEGSVTAQSDGAGKGSTFLVRLPRAVVHADSSPAQTPADAVTIPTNGACVLVVDDNVDAAEMLAAALSMHGCDVHVAHDGPTALRIAAERRFDAALLDIGLPVMDGYELAARLRELPTVASTRLVAVTGYGQESDRQRAKLAGFRDHLVKPVDLGVLASIVSTIQDQ